MEIVDLEELKPKTQKLKVKSYLTKKKYIIDIIYNAGVMAVQQKFKDEPEKQEIETVSAVCRAKYPEMDVEWVDANFSHDDIGAIYIFVMYNFNYAREQAQKLTFAKDVKKKKTKSFLAKLLQR